MAKVINIEDRLNAKICADSYPEIGPAVERCERLIKEDLKKWIEALRGNVIDSQFMPHFPNIQEVTGYMEKITEEDKEFIEILKNKQGEIDPEVFSSLCATNVIIAFMIGMQAKLNELKTKIKQAAAQ